METTTWYNPNANTSATTTLIPNTNTTATTTSTSFPNETSTATTVGTNTNTITTGFYYQVCPLCGTSHYGSHYCVYRSHWPTVIYGTDPTLKEEIQELKDEIAALRRQFRKLRKEIAPES